jgi:hypothetical protein
MTMEYIEEVIISDEEMIEVVIEGECKIVDNSFSHAFGTETVFDVELESMTYDKTEYSEDVQKIIDAHLENEYERIETWFIENYEEYE